MYKVLMTTPYYPEEKIPSGIASFVMNVSRFNRNIEPLKLIVKANNIFSTFGWLYKTTKVIKGPRYHNVDVIHLNTAGEVRAIFRDLSYLVIVKMIHRNIKVVLHLHGGRYTFKKPPFILALTYFIIFSMADECIDLYEGASLNALGIFSKIVNRKTTVLGNPVLTSSRISLDEFKRSRGYLYLGRFSPEKKLDELIVSFSKALSEGVCGPLVICGDGPEKKRLNDLVETLGLSQDVFIFDPVFGKEKEDLLRSTRFVIINSSYEGFPYLALESMAFSCICISTPVGKLKNIFSLEGAGGGFLVEGSSITSEDILRISRLDDKKLFALAQEGFFLAKERYSVEVIYSKLSKVYEKLFDLEVGRD